MVLSHLKYRRPCTIHKAEMRRMNETSDEKKKYCNNNKETKFTTYKYTRKTHRRAFKSLILFSRRIRRL